ncbi:MAG TPA: DEAD/DEAH box helicase [Pseudomonadota bacterium]|nr:DEAD/DEAH box helicase [Rhodanobacteraceae bacterium]MBP9154560.1 DEAD/DEAH box helicase [Xanthomonadales bacterium]HQW80301.1 DEAD/DEAH box helicase [Pseudomonadota bacterium]
MSFSSLGLTPAVLRALVTLGHDTPTPVQLQAIPLVLAGHDLLAAAQTGTGKTGGFALPVLTNLFPEGAPRHAGRTPRVLVLTPTRELAAQVHDSFKQYGAHVPLRSTTIFGGVGMQPQVDALRRGLDIVIATPGRLIDHMGQRTIDLRDIEVLILDEADRMLDMGFLPALKRVLQALPHKRQTLMFSATFSDEIKQLAAQFLRDPREVSVTPRNTIADTIQHIVHPVDASRKRSLLIDVMAQDSRRQTLVFARTKHGANKLAESLDAAGFKSAAIHGNKSQGARTKALADFKSGRITVLVATDIAARGLDIPQLPVVINFDLPMVAEDYVHRIGRTGRAGETGQAISLVSHDESGLLHDIQRKIKQEIVIQHFEGYVPSGPLRIDAGAPRPIMGGRGGQRGGGGGGGGGQRSSAGKPGAHRPHHAKPASTGAKPGQRRNQDASRGNAGGGSRSGWTSRA